ncbi:hypothetical protein TNIN_13691 [Trichonephila inaurata madagascariensis]|uniref:Uncharacterized protein n=1 Tax=Trichonephila inaurata madagascariensis TaxID=2747483 RepID=A0A8X7BSU6_9ARAC|nr:hypothetical protein TNIN_13691 [Trichonephila inaurata madagascariensis]
MRNFFFSLLSKFQKPLLVSGRISGYVSLIFRRHIEEAVMGKKGRKATQQNILPRGSDLTQVSAQNSMTARVQPSGTLPDDKSNRHDAQQPMK